MYNINNIQQKLQNSNLIQGQNTERFIFKLVSEMRAMSELQAIQIRRVVDELFSEYEPNLTKDEVLEIIFSSIF